MHGILVIDKPSGMNSTQISRDLQRKFNFQKIGHIGTLDPLASGVLPICVNEATKMSSYLLEDEKEYEGICLLGVRTDTQDITGKVMNRSNLLISNEILEQKLKSKEGWIEQLPPMFSAVKKGGKPLYIYARRDEIVERSPRRIRVYEFKMKKRIQDEFSFYLRCSKGTYVRALCDDLGEELGSYACLKELRRIRSGMFNIRDSISCSTLTAQNLTSFPHWKSLEEIFRTMPSFVLSEELSKRVRHGYSPLFSQVTQERDFLDYSWICFLDDKHRPIALATPKKEEKVFKISRVINC